MKLIGEAIEADRQNDETPGTPVPTIGIATWGAIKTCVLPTTTTTTTVSPSIVSPDVLIPPLLWHIHLVVLLLTQLVSEELDNVAGGVKEYEDRPVYQNTLCLMHVILQLLCPTDFTAAPRRSNSERRVGTIP